MADDVQLEVIVSSLDDAHAAAAGGAHRAEVVSRLDEDGLTPPRELVERMLAEVDLPLRVMVRPANVFDALDAGARRAIVEDARQWAGLPLDGVVTGYLTADGAVDEAVLAEVADASGQQVTFHRAIERIRTPFDEAIAALKRVPAVDRILYNGGVGDWAARGPALARLQEMAAPLVVIAGGGVDAEGAGALAEGRHVREVHVGRVVRAGQRVDGTVDAEAVRQILARIARAESS